MAAVMMNTTQGESLRIRSILLQYILCRMISLSSLDYHHRLKGIICISYADSPLTCLSLSLCLSVFSGSLFIYFPFFSLLLLLLLLFYPLQPLSVTDPKNISSVKCTFPRYVPVTLAANDRRRFGFVATPLPLPLLSLSLFSSSLPSSSSLVFIDSVLFTSCAKKADYKKKLDHGFQLESSE